MKRKLNARTITLLSLIGALLCALLAAVVCVSVHSNTINSAKEENTTTIVAPEVEATPTANTVISDPSWTSTTAGTGVFTVQSAEWKASAVTFTLKTDANMTITVPSGWSRSSVNISAPAGTKIGDYTVTVKPKSGYCWSDKTTTAKTLTARITRINIGMYAPGIYNKTKDWSSSALTWDITYAHTGTIVTGPSGWTCEYNKVTAPAGTAPGKYTVYITPDEYHMWSNGTTTAREYTLEIVKRLLISSVNFYMAGFDREWTSGQCSWSPYMGTEGLVIEGPSGWSCSYSSIKAPAGQAIGSYELTTYPAENYVWSDGTTDKKTITVRIVPVSVTVPKLSKTSVEWSKNSQTVTLNTITNMTISAMPSGLTRSSTTITIPANPTIKSYSFTASLPDTTHYKWGDGTTTAKTLTLEITKAKLLINGVGFYSAGFNRTWTSGQCSWSPYMATEGLVITGPSGWSCAYNGIKAPAGQAVGPYTLTTYPDSNHTWNDGTTTTKTITVNITAATLSDPTLDKSSLTYSPNAQTVTLSSEYLNATLPAGWTRSGATITVSAGATAQSYSISVTPDSNHTWSDDTTTAKPLSITIDKATPVASASLMGGVYAAGAMLSTVGITGTADVGGSFGWTDPTEVMTFGTASYGWTFTPNDTDNYEIVTGTIQITAVGMDEITADGQKTTYKAFEKFTPDGMTVYAISSGVKRAVTGYTYTVDYGDGRDHFLVEDSGCEVTITYTEGITTKSFTFTVTVGKADVDMSGVTFADDTATYDEQLHKITYSGELPVGVSFSKYTYDGAENSTGVLYAGSYEVKAYFSVTDSANYNAPTLTATLTINKASQEVNVSVANKYYYVGDALSTVQIAADLAGTVSWANPDSVIMGTTGSYGWTFVPADSDNYNTVTGVVTVTAYYKVTGITVTGANTTYKAHESFDPTGMVVTASYETGKVDTAVEGYTVSYPRENATDFIIADDGKNMTVTYTENGITVTATIEITIIANEYDMSGVSMDDLTVTYDGKTHSITYTGTLPEGVHVTGYTYNGTSATGMINADTYEVVAVITIDDPDNYKLPTLSATLTIDKATPTVAVTVADGYYYVGDALSTVTLEADFDGTVSFTNPSGIITGTTGSYGWTLVPDDTTNYNNATGVVLVTAYHKLTGITVTGANTSYKAHESFDPTGMVVTASYATGKVDTVISEDDYELSYPREGATEFIIADDGRSMTVTYEENGITVTAEIEITVIANEYDMSGVSMDDLTVTYDGENHELTITGELPEGLTFNGFTYNGVSGADGVKNADTYEVAVVFGNGDPDNYKTPELKATLTINKATPKVEGVELVSGKYYKGAALSTVHLTYDEGSTSPEGSIAWDDGTVKLGTAEDGRYKWVFTPNDTTNYETVEGWIEIAGLQAKVEEIEVIDPTTEYEAYESFVTEGVKVLVTYLDETTEEVDISECTLVYPDSSRDYFLVGDDKITIWYGNVSTTVSVTVSKKSVDTSGVTFDDKLNEVYDGSSKSIIAENLPDGIAVDYYTYAGEKVDGVTDVGTYEVKAYFTVTDDPDNIAVPEAMTATLKISQAEPEITVEVDYGRYPEGTTLSDVALKYDCDVDGTLSWTVGSIVIEDDGEYEWTFKPTDTKNYKTVKGTLTVEIFYEVSSIQVTVNKTVYEAYDKLEKEDITVRAIFVDKAPANVDGWTVTYPNGGDCFLVADTDEDVIITYNDAEFIIHVTVNKKTVDTSGVGFDDKLNEVYDGSTKSIIPENLPEGVAVDYYLYNTETVNGVKDAGDYVVTVYFKVTDDNLAIDTESKTANLHVEKADIELKFNGNTSFPYTGETITIESGASVNNGEQTAFTYTNNTFLNVSDSGVMTITVAASTNYKGASIEVDITINPAELTLTWTGGNSSYDGYSHSAELTVVSGAVEGDKEVITAENLAELITVSYTGTDPDRKQKGDYTVTLTNFPESGVYANYTYTVTNDPYTFTIGDSDLKLTFKGDTVVYDGEEHTLAVEGMPAPEEMTVTYYCDGEVFTSATDKGTYEVEARFECLTTNFTAPEPMKAILVIEAKDISDCEVDGVDEEHMYDGKAYRPEDITVTLDGKELVNGKDFEVTYTGTGANAESTGKVTITGKGNFGGSVDIEYVIVRRELEIEWDEGEYYYNGDPQGVTARLTNVVDGEEVNIEITYTDGAGNASTTMPTKAGTYTATVTLDSPYENYTLSESSVTFEIKMADVEVELTYAEGYKSNLFDGMAMPNEDVLTVVATSDGKTVEGTFKWTQSSFVWGTEEYSWTFEPDDPNYNVKQGTENFTVREAKITKLTVAWVDDTHPAIYTSTTLDAIRNYLVVTGTLENNQTIDIAGYALTCDGFAGQVPSRPGTYTLKVKFNGKDATISVKYDAVDCNGIKIENADGKEIKKDYYTFDKFDTSTIKVIATFTDGSERVLSDSEYKIVYVTDGSETMLFGDKYVKVSYNEKEEPIYVTVAKKPYDTSSWNFADKTSTYDGNGQGYTIEGVGDDFYVEYEYYKKNADGTWAKLASKDEVKNAGEYKTVATIRPVGDISDNYTYPETLESLLTISKLTPDIGKPGVGGNLSVGTKLSELSLSVEIDGITGTFIWDNEEQVLKEGVNVCRYTFVPDDANYNVVRGSIELPAGGAASADGAGSIGGVGGSGVSAGMFSAILVVLVVSIIISLIALIVAFKKKGVVSDGDGFYEDATPEQMGW